jgi:hypothetical protein
VGPIIGQRLWEVDLSDVEWLAEDCRARPDGHDRQVAFSAVFSILQNANQVVTRRELLEQLAATDPVLAADLAEYREPYRESDSLRESKARQRRARAQREQQQEKDKRSWREFQANLIAEPSVLSRPESLATWKAGLWRLHELTRWLRLRTKNDSPQAARDWRLLEEGFDASVAERFFEGMKQAARRIKPERPEYQGNSTYTTKYSSVLAIAAIFAESSDVTSWGSSLTEGEIATVAMHACFQGYNDTDWFRWLAVNRTSIVEPILLDAVSTEYRSKGAYSDVLSYYAYHEAPPASVANKLVQLLRAKEPANDITLERSLIVLSRATESLSGERRVRSLLRRRMLEHLARNDVKKALQYFSLFARLAPDESVELLDEILPKNETETEAQHADRTHRWLTTLFSRDTRGQLSGVLKQLSIDSLKRLIRTMYSYLPPREVGAVGCGG